MTPFRFGPPQRQLYGIYHAAEPGRNLRMGVLLCNPFGQEAVRTHRMFRVLADRLSRAGMHVLRFDYHGTGDSSGDDTDGDLEAWRDDVLLAHHELHRRSMGAGITWVGARLGATIAAQAARHSPGLAEHLVLWEPIADGMAYLAAMVKHHRHALALSFGVVPPVHRQVPSHEAMGFEMSDKLLAQLHQLTPASLAGMHARRATLIALPHDRSAAAFADAFRAQGSPFESVAFHHSFDWASEEALNTALVPHEALSLLDEHITRAAQP